MKKLLLLGGLRYLLPVIKAAHEQGYYVITCDYIPENIAHSYADEYRNVSITDKEAVLALAKELKVDGVMSFAVDPGVVTAAYVCEQLDLPFCGSLRAIMILQNKALFRNFLAENGFNVPKAKGYSSIEDVLNEVDFFTWPVIVKPVDSAGSKGVTKVESVEKLREGVEKALAFSRSGEFIMEEFIEKDGFSSDSDCFSVNGEFVFASFSDQRFDIDLANPYTPSAYSWPSTTDERFLLNLKTEIQRLLKLLDLKTSIYNIESRVGRDGKAYIMEVSPRGGGNRLAEMLRYSTGVDLITNAVRAAVGDEVRNITEPVYRGYWAEVILHSDRKGIFQRIEFDADFQKKHVVEIDLWVAGGDHVNVFNGANDAIGTLVLKFESAEQLSEKMCDQKDWMKVIVE